MTMLHRKLIIAGLLASVALLAAACGGQATPDVNATVEAAIAQTLSLIHICRLSLSPSVRSA